MAEREILPKTGEDAPTLPIVLEGHWTSPDGHNLAVEYASKDRPDLCHGEMSDGPVVHGCDFPRSCRISHRRGIMTENRSVAFTAGPWVVSENGIYGDNGWQVAVTPDQLEQYFTPEGTANGFLIAAAPELYEALEQLLAITDDPANEADEEESVFPFARRVLAKARGKVA